MDRASGWKRNDSRIIIHFDYDCFYASVFEAENPALKAQPLAVQQKYLLVTCNYEARRRGLYKMQSVAEAKKVCPDVVIVLGEDLTRFRNASKELHNFLQRSIWSGQAERLGFDEVFLDCTDMVDYNEELLNHNDLSHSFFCLDRIDPTVGFEYDASQPFGPTYPPGKEDMSQDPLLYQRLVLGSHLARYLRHELENEKGYTATVGISTNKVLSKLVGNLNKPNSQTTMVPPYESSLASESNVATFMDAHDVGKVPGIGFKLSQKIRARILGRQPTFDDGLVYGGTKEGVTVKDVRTFPGMGSEMLEEILSGPGSQKGIGGKIWGLLNGVDDTEVSQAKRVPSQISIEDSYIRLVAFEEVKKELTALSANLIRRMHLDLMEEDGHDAEGSAQGLGRRKWLAHPKTLRLSTRPRPGLNPDGTRVRSFNRISRSMPMPSFAFSLTENTNALAERLVQDALIPAFRKLHPERSGWNLSLVNVAVTNMAETAADSKDSEGRDISRMFRKQDAVLKEWRVADVDVAPEIQEAKDGLVDNASDDNTEIQATAPASWDSDEEAEDVMQVCNRCGVSVPTFALIAHDRFHEIPD